MLKIKVSGQVARKFEEQQLVSDAINFIPIEFQFNEQWEELSKTYQFQNDKKIIDVVSNNSIINIPHEVLVPGTLLVKIIGKKLSEDGTEIEVKATTNPVEYLIISSKLEIGENEQIPTPDVIEQIRQKTDDSNNKVAETLLIVSDIEDRVYALLTVKDDVEQIKSEVQKIKEDVQQSETNVEQMTNAFLPAEEQRVLAEQQRQDAEELREINISTAMQNIDLSIDDANESAQLAINKANDAENASILANEKANLAQTTINEMNIIQKDLQGWLDNPEQFKGDKGLSAYEIWLSQGNVGSESDFLASLKGEPGEVTMEELDNKISVTHYTATEDEVVNIIHNLNYNEQADDLLVFYGGLFLESNLHYTNADSNSIDLIDWHINKGEQVIFKIYRDVRGDGI